jgi:hypothetical protein
MEMIELYNSNPKFKEYVDKYCKQRSLTLYTALHHNLVKEVGKMYASGNSEVRDVF